jgi:hypothetical protein
MVIKPVISQTKISQPALPTVRVISALTIKIPEPIMLPATINVPSSKPSVGLNEVDVVVVLVVSAIDYNIGKTTKNAGNYLLFLIGRIQPIHEIRRDIVDRVLVVDKGTWIVFNNVGIALLLVIVPEKIFYLLTDIGLQILRLLI